MIVGQQLVAGLESERLQDCVHAGRGVGDEGQTFGIRTKEATDRLARVGKQARQLPRQEPDRLRLETIAPRPLDLEYRLRTRAVRAVIEERDLGIESPAEIEPHRAMTGVEITSPERATIVSPS